MNTKPGLSLIAAVLNGPRFVAARPSTTPERVWIAWQPPASSSVDIQFNGAKPAELWSSAATRAIHRVEEFVMLLIMLHFAVGMLGILFGW